VPPESVVPAPSPFVDVEFAVAPGRRRMATLPETELAAMSTHNPSRLPLDPLKLRPAPDETVPLSTWMRPETVLIR
jgi:hypothetical protein